VERQMVCFIDDIAMLSQHPDDFFISTPPRVPLLSHMGGTRTIPS